MDPEELEPWYDEQKEVLYAKYLDPELNPKINSTKYLKEIHKLRKKYSDLVEKSIKVKPTNKISGKIQKLISKIKKN